MGIKTWWRRRFGKDQKTDQNAEVISAYQFAGYEFGVAVSYIYMGECVGFEDLLKRWEDAESAYVSLGYRAISVDDFVSFGAYGIEIESKMKVPRKVGEQPVLHARYYRENFLGKLEACDAVSRAMRGEVSVGHYQMPSTKHLEGQ